MHGECIHLTTMAANGSHLLIHVTACHSCHVISLKAPSVGSPRAFVPEASSVGSPRAFVPEAPLFIAFIPCHSCHLMSCHFIHSCIFSFIPFIHFASPHAIRSCYPFNQAIRAFHALHAFIHIIFVSFHFMHSFRSCSFRSLVHAGINVIRSCVHAFISCIRSCIPSMLCIHFFVPFTSFVSFIASIPSFHSSPFIPFIDSLISIHPMSPISKCTLFYYLCLLKSSSSDRC